MQIFVTLLFFNGFHKLLHLFFPTISPLYGIDEENERIVKDKILLSINKPSTFFFKYTPLTAK